MSNPKYPIAGMISIGYVAENESREIALDISQLMRQWPDLTPVLIARRPNETDVYIGVTRREGDALIWKITNADTAIAGEGEMRIYMTDESGKVLGKSRIVRTKIGGGIEGETNGNLPVAVQPWVESVLEEIGSIKDGYVRLDQGAENAGKALVVGKDGNVTLTTAGAGAAATLTITGADELAYGETPTVTEQDGSSEQARVYRLGIPAGKPGTDGKDGSDGKDGADGKTAYQYAQDGGYTGTQEEFAAKLAREAVKIDATLKNEGEAADAGAVGAALDELNEAIDAHDERIKTLEQNAETGESAAAGDFLGFSGINFYDNGNIRSFSPIANSTALNARVQKISAYAQEAAEQAEIASTADVLAHECSIARSSPYNTPCLTWVENVAGTTADVPGTAGVTCVKGRCFSTGNNSNFPTQVPAYITEPSVIAQMGDEATDTLTGETFTIPGGTGYQTSIDDKCLFGWIKGYAKLRGMTCTLTPDGSVLKGTSLQTWTLTIDGELGDYDYSRLPDGLTGATLHPSNQIAKISSTYYRADVVPSNGFIVFSSPDLINWTYLGHATYPDGFADNGSTEACCGTKGSRLYVAVRQSAESACLYLCKMNTDMITVNSIVALPDCGSKPCFSDQVSIGGVKGFFLATAPIDRYSCRVYWCPGEYAMTHIIPVYELHGRACNYPFMVYMGSTLLIAGTNGAQVDCEGVEVVPMWIYPNAFTADLPAADTLVARMPDNTDHAFGRLYEMPTFETAETEANTETTE